MSDRPSRLLQALVRAGLLSALLTSAVHAATVSTTFNVTATVIATCSVSATNVAFGNYGSAQLDATGTISVSCTSLAPYVVELDAGTGSGATIASRRMTGPSSQTLTYSLYSDASRAVLWGTTAGLQSVAGVGNGATQSLTVYGRIPAAQYPGAGSYSDTITVTVTY